MIKYKGNGDIEQLDRDVVGEICDKYNESGISDALRKAGYVPSLEIGDPEAAALELYLNVDKPTEFAGVAYIWICDGYEEYVFETKHAVMLFLKEFTPMIESVVRLYRLPSEN
ncbi:hypothetical protein [Pseudomonas sp. LS.1a]|uniref:hypothetical protein n=1 Tax=Pseudomonas sp. LS.1a TaxID=2920387 RepID=UPI001F135EF7|nr:hypothetical protein [Pseudomonas sp. LS.1a]UMY62027.1 hypothetical protein MKK04_01800 [Pseudomonas sp. LS.1a]